MSKAARVAVLLATIVLCSASLGCQEMFDQLETSLPGAERPLSQSPDVGEQAASQSHEAAEKEGQAQEHLNAGLENKDLTEIEKAIELRQRDASYRFYRAAWYLARGWKSSAENQQVNRWVMDAVDVSGDVSADEGRTGQEADIRMHTQYMDALLVTRNTYARTSPEWMRLNYTYCVILSDFLGTKFEDRFSLSLVKAFYPDETCPGELPPGESP